MIDSSSSSPSELPRIGPGLGSRSSFWAKIRKRIIHENKTVQDASENEMLIALASGKRWLDMVPPEWIEIYGALHAESKYFMISESERNKIDKDIGRTFSLFTRNARLLRLQFKVNMNGYSDALQNVLMAASHERGYCQGINFIAAVFLLYQADEKEAFTLLCYLLKQRYMEILYNPKCSSLLEYMNYFEKRLRKHNKRIYKYFKHIDYSPVCYSIEWFTTCFIVTCPGELSSCVLDLILVGFDDIMIRVGLAMLDHLEDQLLKLDLETMQLEFKPLASKADPYDVMFRALTIQYPPNTRQNLLKTMAQNIEVMNPRAELVNTLRVTKKEEDEPPTPVKESPLVINMNKQSKKKSILKQVRKQLKSDKTGKIKRKKAGDVSPVSPSPVPTHEIEFVPCSADEYADDEGVNTGSRRKDTLTHTKKKVVKSRGKERTISNISPITPLSDNQPIVSHSYYQTNKSSKNITNVLKHVAKDPLKAMRNELHTFKGLAHNKPPSSNNRQVTVVTPPPRAKAADLPVTSRKRRKQSKPETRFSKQFLKRIPSRRLTSYNAPHIAADLAEWEDSFTNTKEYVKKTVKRMDGIQSTPVNTKQTSTTSNSNPSTTAASIVPKSKVLEEVPKPPVLPIGATGTNRMLLDPESPLNVEKHEKKEAKLLNHLFPPAPPKKSQANNSNNNNSNNNSTANSPTKQAPGSSSTNGSKPEPKKVTAPTGKVPASTPQQQPQQSGSMWFDKMVQDTIWFTTFGLVHAPTAAPPPPSVTRQTPPVAPRPQSRSVKEANLPSWVLKKELQNKNKEDIDDALVWIPGTQEGYDGDISHSDCDFEGEGGTRRERRNAHRAGNMTSNNRSKMLSIDIHGRSNLVEDLENPIDLLSDIREKWFVEDNKMNAPFKILNKQYHNDVNIAIRKKRNKLRSFKEKI